MNKTKTSNKKSIIKKTILFVISGAVIVGLMYVGNEIANTRVFSEKRAKKNADSFVKQNNIAVKRLTCAGDSVDPKYKVRDGYGTCALVTETEEKIMLQCPANFLENLLGAKNCKEYFITFNITSNTQK
jgi:hypothetical protein